MKKLPLTLVAAVCGLTLVALAEDKPAQPDMKAMMEQAMKLMQPNEKHAGLAKMVGEWKAKVTMFDPMTGQPTVTDGTATFSMILDGRYLKEDFKGTFMGQPYTGTGYTGYDTILNHYQATWMDSMGTSMMFGEGSADDSGKVITMTGEMSCPINLKEKIKFREVITLVSDTEQKFELYSPGPDGKEAKGMEILYTKNP